MPPTAVAPIERTLAEYAVAERSSVLPAEVVHHAKRAVIDWFAALLPGAGLPPASSLVHALADDLGHGPALLFPSGLQTVARTAALVNGTAAHLVEFDDIFRDAVYHPGAPVIAAALAAGQHADASGDQVLRAIVAGYEVSTRIALALTPAHYTYWHTTGTVGTLGAAVAASVVLGLDASEVAHALATAATFAAGLQQAFRSDAMSKPLHAGRAAEAGVLAGLLAARGVTGAANMLDGEFGLGRATSKTCDWPRATEALGSRYNITAITIKNHGCCGHTFAAIDAMLALRQRHGLTPANVARIEVETYRVALDVTGNANPEAEHEARFSLPFVVASALVHGSVRLDAFTEARLAGPVVRGTMQNIELRVDPGIDAGFPAQRAARVTVQTRDGHRFQHLQPTRKGDPDLPLTDHELEAKYHELARPVLGAERANRLLDALWTLDTLDHVRRIDTGASEPIAVGA